MPRLYRVDNGETIATISDDHLKFLVDQLEEEYAEDKDYYINRTMLEVMRQNGADPGLIAQFSKAIGDRDGVEIEWSRI